MTKIRKNVILLLMAMTLLFGVCALTACGSKDSASVKFMVQNDNGVWEQYYVSDAKDGKVTMPQNPEKTNYVFRDWYDYSGDPVVFRNEDVTSAKTVYAYFVPAEVKISLNGGNGETTKLEQLETYTYKYTAEALKDNLSFDGWYTDADYAVKYEEGADVTELYARFLAHVAFNDGWQTLYEADIPLGQNLTAPKAVVGKDSEGNDVTFEQKNILQNYMDPVSVSYVCDGNNVDFTKSVSGNMSVKVRWQSPGLSFSQDRDSGNYYVDYIDNRLDGLNDYPVVSVLSSNAVVGQSGSGDNLKLTYGNVTGVMTDVLGTAYGSARKYIFEEGIEWIAWFNGSANSSTEEIEFPSTLKVLEKSLNVMPRLKEVNLPSKLVSVLDCFWADYETIGNLKGPKSDETYSFDITLPESVSNVVRLPENVKFAENSPFTRDETDSRIYKIDGRNKILVSDYSKNIVDGVLSVPNGTTQLQVGLYSAMKFDTLQIPATVTDVSFNASTAIVPGYYNATQNKGGLLYRKTDIADPIKGNAGADWCSVVSTLGNRINRVEFDRTSLTSKLNKDYYYVNSPSYYAPDTTKYTEMNGFPVVCTKAIDAGKAVTISVRAYSKMTGFDKFVTFKTVKSGETLTQETLSAALGLNEVTYDYAVTSLTEMGKPYQFGESVARNLYIEMTFDYAKQGIVTKDNGDGTLTVTGFDSENAQLVDGETSLYIVNIPAVIDGKTVVAIADEAFMYNDEIAEVYIKNTVKTIGASAFAYTTNLRKFVVETGGLETIKTNAFLNAGCYYDSTKNQYVVSGDGIEFSIPLANLKEIAPYALKTKAIKVFTPVEGENDRRLMWWPWADHFIYPDKKEGDFFYVFTNSDVIYGIVKYMGTEVVNKKNISGGETAVNVLDVQYVATAGGVINNGGTFGVGRSLRYYSSMVAEADNYVMRYEVMEGSVYYLDYNTDDNYRSFNEITLGIVKKIHANAFTDMVLDKISYYDSTSILDGWTTPEQIKNQDSSVFEEGWWQGTPNSVMKEKLTADLTKNTDSTL